MRPSRALLAMLSCALWAQSVAGQQSDWDHFMSEGDSAMAQEQYAQAEDSYRRALRYAEAHWRNDARLPGTLIKLAEACNAGGKKNEAEGLANRSAAELSEALKKHEPKDASEEMMQADTSVALLTKAGDLFAVNEKFPDAEAMYQKAIAVRENYAAAKPPSKPSNEDFLRFMAQALGNAQAKVADARDKLGSLYRREQKFQQAEGQFQQSEAIREKVFGADQPPVAQSLGDLAMCHALQGQYEQAVPLYQKVVAILENSKLRESPEMAIALENYSLALRKAGREAEAQPFADSAREIRSKLSSGTHTPQ